ncbi:MAG TPA: VanZ family protein [Thermoanaerobaculia bacterium]|nr:VanZ family protein [Thermoanaerobaculia bacterium]
MRRDLLALGWAALVGWLLTAPAPAAVPVPPWVPAWAAAVADEAVHAVLFAVLALTTHRALAGHRLPAPLLLATALTVAYGAVTELAQRGVPGRSAELSDLLADALGALVYATWARRGGPGPMPQTPPARSPDPR